MGREKDKAALEQLRSAKAEAEAGRAAAEKSCEELRAAVAVLTQENASVEKALAKEKDRATKAKEARGSSLKIL